jgi:hypothetical protein
MGGYGVVWDAWHEMLQIPLAIKTIDVRNMVVTLFLRACHGERHRSFDEVVTDAPGGTTMFYYFTPEAWTRRHASWFAKVGCLKTVRCIYEPSSMICTHSSRGWRSGFRA